MAVERNGAKTDVVVKLVLVFFVCLMSFSIGVFVGKKFSDNQHKMAKYEPSAHGREVASVPPTDHHLKPNDALTDDEVAKLAEEFVTDEAASELPMGNETLPMNDKNTEIVREAKGQEPASGHQAEPAATHQKTGTTGAHVEPMAAARRVAQNAAPAPESKPAATAQNRIPSSLPQELATSALGKYTVQIASYPEEEEAKKAAAQLKGQQFNAFYVPAKIKDRKSNTEKTWYRVSVGLFPTQKEAEEYMKDLLARSKVSSAIVQKISE